MAISKFLCNCDKLKLGITNNKTVRRISDLPDDFTVTYHAGAMHTKPNTLQSIVCALDHGAKTVEFDVSFRPDGTPVIIHNSSPEADQGVLLSEALRIVAANKNCKINLDLKSTANLTEVDKLVKENGLFERVFYTGVFEDWVEKVKKDSAIPYYLNHSISKEEAESPEKIRALIDKTKTLGAMGINSKFTYANKMFVDMIRENSLLVSLWTVNKASDMLRVIDLAPDNITTKKPHIIEMLLR